MKEADIVGHAIADVLPQTDKYWVQIPHLRRLNLILLVPLLSSAVAGYDGKYTFLVPFGDRLDLLTAKKAR